VIWTAQSTLGCWAFCDWRNADRVSYLSILAVVTVDVSDGTGQDTDRSGALTRSRHSPHSSFLDYSEFPSLLLLITTSIGCVNTNQI
jgi:hypothetical protein